MGLADQLESGELGIRCRVGETEILEQSPHFALLLHPGRQLALHVVKAPWHLDGRHTSAWKQAIEQHTQLLFEDSFRPEQDPGTGLSTEPRTRNQTWSPLIGFEEIDAGAPAWWLLFRRSYAPGDELVEGRLLVPVATGLVTVSLLARDTITGYRESALALSNELPGTNATWPQSTQALFDDPANDARFPEHCLSRVRDGLRWLLAPDGAALVCTAPAAPAASDTIALPEADSVVTPPPRFAYLPAGTLPLAPSLASFSSVILGGDEAPRLLSVWSLEQRLPKSAGTAGLEALVRQTLSAWTLEGARDIELNLASVSGALGPETHVHVRFQAHGAPRQEQQIWFTDRDRSVFRIGVDAPSDYAQAELRAEVAAVRQSWRRLSPKRRWWQI
jgi:hypothetical protein